MEEEEKRARDKKEEKRKIRKLWTGRGGERRSIKRKEKKKNIKERGVQY